MTRPTSNKGWHECWICHTTLVNRTDCGSQDARHKAARGEAQDDDNGSDDNE